MSAEEPKAVDRKGAKFANRTQRSVFAAELALIPIFFASCFNPVKGWQNKDARFFIPHKNCRAISHARDYRWRLSLALACEG
ncbi:MAG TPA: hypothetical protein VFE47_21280, partial [Tepidisphaeraceae bacterium]|nr:hypothetical protein [Tepidisphaeraceae bacterium]